MNSATARTLLRAAPTPVKAATDPVTHPAIPAQSRQSPDQQSVVVSGTGAVRVVLPQLAAQLAQLGTSRAEVLAQVEKSWRPTLFTNS